MTKAKRLYSYILRRQWHKLRAKMHPRLCGVASKRKHTYAVIKRTLNDNLFFNGTSDILRKHLKAKPVMTTKKKEKKKRISFK